MKALLRIFRPSRKLAFIVGGVGLFAGVSGGAAVYVGKDKLMGPSYEEVNGMQCTDVNLVTIRKQNHLWIRKYIKTEPTDGMTRIKTALRVAGAVSNAEDADLYQIILIDAAGPEYRADMRGRAIGAEVLFARDPSAVPGMSAPFVARYTDGVPAANGEFYGERKELSLDEIKTIVTAMKERTDCIDPNAIETAASGHGEAKEEGGHGAEGEHAAAEGTHEVASSGH